MNRNINRKTLFVGKDTMVFPSLPSTNLFTVDYVSKNTPSEGTVICTPHQTAGRGQIGSRWESEADKNITMSVVLYPKFLIASDQFFLIKIIGLAVKEFLDEYMERGVSIKWPNDIYVNNKKIAGILIQNTLRGRSIKNTVVGIGININQTVFVSNAPNPTSLKLETEKNYDLSTLQQNLCWFIEKWYFKLKNGQLATINNSYHTHLYRNGEEAQYRVVADGNVFRGKIIGTSPSGQLEVETSTGLKRFSIKEIQFL